jgi:cellulose biosynthesis protein BcsQ
MIAALPNQKNGVAQTTRALHFAGRAVGAGERVTLIDAQPHTSALDPSQQRSREGDPA